MLRESGGGFNPDLDRDVEEEVDVEQIIAEVEQNCADVISSDNAEQFEEIFDAARRTYSDPEARGDWDQLFDSLQSELIALEDEDDVSTVLRNYAKKAKALG